MQQRVYNTLGGEKQDLVPLEPGRLKVYVCGPTVYDHAHLGHARCYVAHDMILRHLRRSFDVTHVRNYTDVDDKIIARAAEAKEDPIVFAERFTRSFIRDMDALGVEHPDVEPLVSTHIEEIKTLIARLIEGEHAYAIDGDVYYSVKSFKDYGQLSGRTLEKMKAGARIEVDPRKHDPHDFALWKAAKPGEISWESPWGPGRPGWHIECSAMSAKHLGESFDIHCGGKDLIFPHHENEIAQSEAASGQRYTRYWLHNGFVTVGAEKMGKSLGNSLTIQGLLEHYDPQTLRALLLSVHYRSPIDFSEQALNEAEARNKYVYETMARLRAALAKFGEGSADLPHRAPGGAQWVQQIVQRFEAAMADDFNTARSLADIGEVFKLVNEVLDKPGESAEDARTLRAIQGALSDIGASLGLYVEDPATVLERMQARRRASGGIDADQVEALIVARREARASKDWSRADEIRGQLDALGVTIKDGPEGTTWEAS
ncbi:MAG: cysteinyl-tRNA synthetase [Planctomycetota bacterium]